MCQLCASATLTNATTCMTCAAGLYMAADYLSCSACSAGSYTTGANLLLTCAHGWLQPPCACGCAPAHAHIGRTPRRPARKPQSYLAEHVDVHKGPNQWMNMHETRHAGRTAHAPHSYYAPDEHTAPQQQGCVTAQCANCSNQSPIQPCLGPVSAGTNKLAAPVCFLQQCARLQALRLSSLL